MNVAQLGESIVNNALKSAGLNPLNPSKVSPRIGGRPSIFANLISAGDSQQEKHETIEGVREMIINKISRKTTIALKSLLEDKGLKEDEELSNMNDQNQDYKEEEDLNPIEESIKKTIDMELSNIYQKESRQQLDDSSSGDSRDSQDFSVISSQQVIEIQKVRNKRIDLNMIKSKRRTINMRLAFLAPSTFLNI